MEEWKEYKLGDIVKLTIDYRGKTPLKLGGAWSTSGYRALSAKNIKTGHIVNQESIRFVDEDLYKKWMKDEVQRGDILITSEAPFGQVYYWNSDEKIVLSQRLFCLRLSEDVCPKYVYYYMTTGAFQFELDGRATGTTVTGLRQPELLKCKIQIPSLAIQQQIAKILSSFDDKIEVNRRINENLEQQAQALFKSWFVDFEPFKDGEFVESELGRIPKGWRVYSMNEIVDVIGGYSYKGNELQESNIAMATIKNFDRNGGFKTNGFKEIIPSSKAKQEQFLNKYDIIIAHTDLTQNADIIGNPVLLLHYGKYEKIIMSMDLVKAKSLYDSISFGLLYSIFADSRFKNHALGYVNGTTVLHLSKKAIPEYRIALPSNLADLSKYSAILDTFFKKESEMMMESDRLASLRDTLLPRLMSGELKINDIGDSL